MKAKKIMIIGIPYTKLHDKFINSDTNTSIEIINLLYNYLNIDYEEQKKVIDEYSKYNYPYSEKIFNLLIGTLYEQEIATILSQYSLQPIYNNTNGRTVNINITSKMKVNDIVVRSYKNDKIYGFDIKHSTVWNRNSDNDNLWLTSSGFTDSKIYELSSIFMEDLLSKYQNVHQKAYIILVCYDLWKKNENNKYISLYESIFHSVPYNIAQISFVVDISKLFKQCVDNFGQSNIINQELPELINLKNVRKNNQYIYIREDGSVQYAIKVNSDICSTLDTFIKQELI